MVAELSALALPGVAALAVLACGGALWALARQRQLVRKLLGAATEPELRAALLTLAAGLAPLEARLRALESRDQEVRAREPLQLCPPGVVHFQAYGGEGPALSFSVALINQHRDGVVLTSLFGRDTVRVFAKPLAAGSSVTDLAEEETAAIALAAGGGGSRNLALAAAEHRAARRGRAES